jgi:hypothetical protein
MTLGATSRIIGILLPLDGRELACYFSTAIEAAGCAWAPSSRAALPVYRSNPTVRVRSTPCR